MFYAWCLLCLMTTGCFGNSALCGNETIKLYGTLGQSQVFYQLNIKPEYQRLTVLREQGQERTEMLTYNLKTKEVDPGDGRFQYNESSARVTLLQLQRADEGVYELAVKINKTVQFCKFHLKVYEQISRLLVSITDGVQNDSCVVTMNCSAEAGDDVFFSWTQDRKTLSHNSSTLVIGITADNANSLYTCRAKNPVSEGSSTLTLPEACSPTQAKSTLNFDPIYIIPAAVAIILVIALVFIIKVCLPKIDPLAISPKRRQAQESIPDPTHQAFSTIYAMVQKRETLPPSNRTAPTDNNRVPTVYELAGPCRAMP